MMVIIKRSLAHTLLHSVSLQPMSSNNGEVSFFVALGYIVSRKLPFGQVCTHLGILWLDMG